MPRGWLLGFKSANRTLVKARTGGRQAANGGASGRSRLQLEALETRCLLSAASMLVVTTPPPSIGAPGMPGSVGIVAGAPFGISVSALKADGTVDTAYNGSVTVSAAPFNSTNTSTPLSGVLTVTAVNGVATFSGLTQQTVDWFNVTISGSELSAEASAHTSIFTTAGPAAQLVITGPASSAFLQTNHNSPMGPFNYSPISKAAFGVEVQAQDRFGNLTTFDGNVTVSLGSNPTGASLSGTLSAHSTGTFVDLTNLTLDKVGSGYTLQVSAPGLTTGVSPAFAVTSKLVVTSQPSDPIIAGSSFDLTVKAVDGLGNVDTSFNGVVNVDSQDGYPLGGTLSATAIDGVATFTGLTKSKASSAPLQVSAYPLVRSILSELPATGSTDYIQIAAATATQLVVNSPVDAHTGEPFSVKIQATDSFGNVNPTYSGLVTIALANNPTGATLGGTLSAIAVNGVVSFTDLSLNNPGTGYTLTATSADLFAGTSPGFSVNRGERDPIAQGNFVAALYHDLLGRVPDSAGSSHWVDQLQTGASRTQVAQAFWESPEHRTIQVTGLYATLLERDADADGLAQWVQMLQGGASESAVKFGFLTSEEYVAKHPTPTSYLSALYDDVLGRTASEVEVTFWQRQFFPSRFIRTNEVFEKAGQIASTFNSSAEASAHSIDQNFSSYLQRTVDPKGEAYWLAAIQSGTSPAAVAEAILGSDEYFALANAL